MSEQVRAPVDVTAKRGGVKRGVPVVPSTDVDSSRHSPRHRVESASRSPCPDDCSAARMINVAPAAAGLQRSGILLRAVDRRRDRATIADGQFELGTLLDQRGRHLRLAVQRGLIERREVRRVDELRSPRRIE